MGLIESYLINTVFLTKSECFFLQQFTTIPEHNFNKVHERQSPVL